MLAVQGLRWVLGLACEGDLIRLAGWHDRAMDNGHNAAAGDAWMARPIAGGSPSAVCDDCDLLLPTVQAGRG